MGKLEGVGLGRDQPGTDEQGNDPLPAGVAEQTATGHAAADRVAVERRSNQTQDNGTEYQPLVG